MTTAPFFIDAQDLLWWNDLAKFRMALDEFAESDHPRGSGGQFSSGGGGGSSAQESGAPHPFLTEFFSKNQTGEQQKAKLASVPGDKLKTALSIVEGKHDPHSVAFRHLANEEIKERATKAQQEKPQTAGEPAKFTGTTKEGLASYIENNGGPHPFLHKFLSEHLSGAAQNAAIAKVPSEKLHKALGIIKGHVDFNSNTFRELAEKELASRGVKTASDSANSMAFDRATVRRYDRDGRMHVEMANISKANICPYYGREIPDAEALGLLPDKTYQLFRDPAELKKGADTSNNIQLMQVHDPVTPDQPKQMKVVGSTGTDAVFEAPYLKNSLAVWTQSAIDLIESDEKKQLSCAYHYRADMTPGTYEGAAYDGVMRDVHFNHVALVTDGRAGADVVVGDSMPLGLNHGDYTMKTSRKALLARGALATYLRPKLAQDAKIDLKAALLGTTALNWPTAKPTIVARVKAMAAGNLAKDASLEDMHGLLDSLDREGEDEMDDEAEDAESEEDKAKHEAKEKADKAAADEEAETAEEKAARMKKRADDKAAKDAEMPEALKAAAEKEAKDKAARDAEPKPITKAAMDAAIAAAVTATQVTQQQIREAERDVFPWIGAVLPQKTPGDVYRLALDSMPDKPNLTDVPPSAFKAILAAYGDPARRRVAPIAMDAAGASDFDKRFPDVSRILAA